MDPYERLMDVVFGGTRDQLAVRRVLSRLRERHYRERDRLQQIAGMVIWRYWEPGYLAKIRDTPVETGTGDELYRKFEASARGRW